VPIRRLEGDSGLTPHDRSDAEELMVCRLPAGGNGTEIRTLGPPSKGLRFFRNSPRPIRSESKTSPFRTGTAGPFPPCRLSTCNRPGIDSVRQVVTTSVGTKIQLAEQPYRETWPLRGRSVALCERTRLWRPIPCYTGKYRELRQARAPQPIKRSKSAVKPEAYRGVPCAV
jgi:hypothetical protein